MSIIVYSSDSPKKAYVKLTLMKMRRMLDLKHNNMWWKDDEVEFVSEFGFKSEDLTREKLMNLIRRIKNEKRS